MKFLLTESELDKIINWRVEEEVKIETLKLKSSYEKEIKELQVRRDEWKRKFLEVQEYLKDVSFDIQKISESKK
jgi:hypothetical protein